MTGSRKPPTLTATIGLILINIGTISAAVILSIMFWILSGRPLGVETVAVGVVLLAAAASAGWASVTAIRQLRNNAAQKTTTSRSTK